MEELREGDPTALGQFQLHGRLGEGGMGEVFLGTSPSGIRFAVKTVRAEFAGDEGFRDRFRREIALARRVDSAWTAPIADADPDAQPPWLATEFLTGLALSEAITRYGPLPEGAVRVLGAQLAEALMAIHRAELIHRDLKPSNVVLGRDRVRVIDFGISRAVDEGGQITSTGRVVGTPSFMSPEQAGGHRLGPESDVFSLGSVLVFAATGHGPFHQDRPAQPLQMMLWVLQNEPDLTEVPDGIRDLIAACLAKEPAARPPLTEVLTRLMGDGAPQLGTSWIPAALVAELERRDQAKPAETKSTVDETAGVDEATPPVEPEPEPAAQPSPERMVPLQPSIPPPPVGIPKPPSEKPKLARRAFLIGGGAITVAAAGGAAGWLLMGDEADPGKRVWSCPAGGVASAYLAEQGDLVYHVAAGTGGGKGQITAIDAQNGKPVWRKATAGSTVSVPLVTKDHLFVVSWTVDPSVSIWQTDLPTTCTVHDFDPLKGDQRWSRDYAARGVGLPTGLDAGLLYLGVSAENSSNPAPGRIVAIDASTHREVWRADMTKETSLARTPMFTNGLVFVFAEPDSWTEPTVIHAYDRAGTPKWEVPFKGYGMGDMVMAGDRLLALVADNRSNNTVVDWQRFAVDAATGAAIWGPIAIKGGTTRDVKATRGIAFITFDGSDDEAKSALLAVDPLTGGQLWLREMDGRNLGEVTRAGDVVYVACYPSKPQAGVAPSATGSETPTNPPATSVNKGVVYALRASTGDLVWKREIPSYGTLGTPAVGSGRVYVTMSATAPGAAGDHASHVYALRVKTGEVAWQAPLAESVASRTVVLAKGNVYIGQWRSADDTNPASSVVAYEA
ncbi:protein kinase domain-containing protein [Embleya sp. AB8]|uniref:serine/threonine-protein kinase n=1 Tax=Embleya sp. AB8 TaxID=3156304 RepID=UPI003C70CE94